jgi:hypothetical protein
MSDYDEPPSPEDIGRHIAEIDDMSRFNIPTSMFDEYNPIVAARKTRLAGDPSPASLTSVAKATHDD